MKSQEVSVRAAGYGDRSLGCSSHRTGTCDMDALVQMPKLAFRIRHDDMVLLATRLCTLTVLSTPTACRPLNPS